MRLNFEFSEDMVAGLKQLQEKCGATTMKDLVNNALTILEWTVNETIDGNEIAAVNEEDKRYRVLVTPMLQAVAKRHAREKALA